MENFSPNLSKILDLYFDINNLTIKDIYDLKKIIDEDVEQIEKYNAFDSIRKAMLLTDNDSEDSMKNIYVANIVKSVKDKYGSQAVHDFIYKMCGDMEGNDILHRIYNLTDKQMNRFMSGQNSNLTSDEKQELKKLREGLEKLKKELKSETGSDLETGDYIAHYRKKYPAY